MDIVYFTLWFMVTLATLWDIRRGQRLTQEIIERMDARTERIVQITDEALRISAEVLRRTPPP